MLLNAIDTITTNPETTFTLYALKITPNKILTTQLRIEGNDLAVFARECLSYLKEKQYLEKEIKEYPCGKPKDHIETIPVTSEMIAERYQQLIAALISPETNNTDISNYGAYVIVSTLNNNKSYFINMKKPLRNFGHSTLLGIPLNENKFMRVNNRLLSLTYHFDCIINQGTCYFITMAAEPVFNLQQYHARQTETCKELLINRSIIRTADKEVIDNYLKKPGKYRALCDFSKDRIDIFATVNSSNKAEYEQKYHITFIENPDGSCSVDVSTEEKLRALISTITLKRAKDFDDIIVESQAPFKPVN